jgi:hypothetical protein
VLLAWTAAAEMPRLNLADALALVVVVRGDRRYERAAARWLARYVLETPM